MGKKVLDPNPDFYELVRETPQEIRRTDKGYFAAFEKTAFGNIDVEIDAEEEGSAELILGEMYDPFYKRIDRRPLENVRNETFTFPVKKGVHAYHPELPAWKGLLKSPTGSEIMPFRLCELSCTSAVRSCRFIRNSVFGKIPMDASCFHCSNAMLEKVWNFCKYTLRATTMFGCFIDGERERLPYEGDSYVTALGYYTLSTDMDVVRRTIDYLMDNPTWPTECMLVMPIIARDYALYSGDTESVKGWFEALKGKLLIPFCFDGYLIDMRRARETWTDEEIGEKTGLTGLFSRWMRDLVDWPAYERDQYHFGDFISNPEVKFLKGDSACGREIAPPNFVPNAMQAASCHAMAEICGFLGKKEEIAFYLDREEKIKTELRRTMRSKTDPHLFDDCPDAGHSACMTDTWALWAHIAEKEDIPVIADHLVRKGMACSVFAAHYLLESLFANGYPADAIKLMADETGFRSWCGMMMQGATITKEAWEDINRKRDWNHAFATSPLHIIPRCLFGIMPVEPGFRRFTVEPKLMFLEHASLVHPTVRGSIRISLRRMKGEETEMTLEVPAGTTADVTFGEQKISLGAGVHTLKGDLPLE